MTDMYDATRELLHVMVQTRRAETAKETMLQAELVAAKSQLFSTLHENAALVREQQMMRQELERLDGALKHVSCMLQTKNATVTLACCKFCKLLYFD